MPSPSEAAAHLAMEALVVGTPVLATEAPTLRDALAGTPAKAIPANAWPSALADAVASPGTDAARAYARDAKRRFDVSRPAEAWKTLLDGLVSARRA